LYDEVSTRARNACTQSGLSGSLRHGMAPNTLKQHARDKPRHFEGAAKPLQIPQHAQVFECLRLAAAGLPALPRV
jgi:hypothetical protein